ncbi:N-acetyltransferase family protein [Frisingicoccus sp.]|uniref:GNAT family N-acetyltransferase n=1 Tax=Frisingicoccus sp. TaxID=1918627 RepID=UPI00399BF3CD
MILQLIKEEDVAEVLEIYAPYVQNTAITFEYEVPSLESFSERVPAIRNSIHGLSRRTTAKS